MAFNKSHLNVCGVSVPQPSVHAAASRAASRSQFSCYLGASGEPVCSEELLAPPPGVPPLASQAALKWGHQAAEFVVSKQDSA